LARDLLGESWRSLPDLRSIQAFEMQTYLPGDILTKEDRATMALSLEARVPMLGKEVLEFAERISDRGKVSRLAGKRLLRQLGRRRLPRQITTGRKRGFAVPLGPLLAEDWRAESIEWFGDLSSELVDGRAAAVMLREDRVPASDIWALATLASWEGRVADARRAAARDSLSAQWT
jgi:asparagine synthase (glutamine-hydrolysing)